MDVPGTRKTILKKLQMTQTDQVAWNEFYAIYWKLVYSVALQAGLSHSDAQEVLQNTFAKVAKNIRKFDYDPSRGKFRNWLCLIAKQQAANLFRKSGPTRDASDTEIRRLPDKANDWDTIWDLEEQKHLQSIALAGLKTKVSKKDFKIFCAHCIEGLKTNEVVERHTVTANEVYLAKHRVRPIFESELKLAQNSEA